jgi:hypothetical protein
LRAGQLGELCQRDEQVIRQTIGNFSEEGPEYRVALIPNATTMGWHHAREEYLAKELLNKVPEIKGALIRGQSGQSTWCIWTRVFGKERKDNTLYILRIVIEGEDQTKNQILPEHVQQVAACLAAAQDQAHAWNMYQVEIWNPSPTVVAGIRQLDSSSEIIHRDSESITSLNWYGENPGIDKVQWIANEKFGWC